MRITILSALLFLASLNLTAQADYGNKGEAIQLCKAIQGSQFSNYREANSAIEDILSVIGAKNRFVVQPCDNINNASAVTMQGIRYIFFDPDFMNSISSGRYSSNLFILAHEVGHHINGHSQDIVMLLSDYAPTSNTLSEQRIEELEADEFAGFIMGKLGHSLSSMQNTLRGVADNGDDTYSTHPSLSKRLKAVETGYNKARGNEALKTKVSSSQQTAAEYFYSAYAKGVSGDNRGAIQDYTMSIKLDPDYAGTYCNRGIAKGDLGDDRGAIQDCNKAIELDPDYATAYYNRGIPKSNLGDYRGAIQDYSKAIELDPYNALAYYNRGVAKSNLGDDRGAIQDYSKAIELNPYNADAYYNKGNAKNNLGDNPEKKNFVIDAIQDYNKAIELNPDNALAYHNRGIAKLKLGDNRGAEQDNNKAIELDPDYATAYHNRGIAKYNLVDKDGACLDWSKAGELGFEDAYYMIKEHCQ